MLTQIVNSFRKDNFPIVILHRFHKPPYGGGNQFLLALKNEWEKMGRKVGAGRIGSKAKSVLFNSFNFDFNLLEKVDRSQIKLVHRVDGPVSAYRGVEAKEDQDVWMVNSKFADVTVFQSRYSLEKHLEMGLIFKNPTIIHNAVNKDIFYQKPKRPLGQKVKLVATSWSNNPKKGARTYQWLDKNLDRSKYELTFVGQIAVDLPNSKVIPPVPSEKLANILREQDIYITASENDSCSNALIEALSCGLPAAFLRSGGNPELVKKGGLGFTLPVELPSILDQIVVDYDKFTSLLDPPKMEEVAAEYLRLMEDHKQ